MIDTNFKPKKALNPDFRSMFQVAESLPHIKSSIELKNAILDRICEKVGIEDPSINKKETLLTESDELNDLSNMKESLAKNMVIVN